MRAISNAGPIIHLSWLNRLPLLSELFEEVLVPSAVRDEVLRAPDDTPGMRAIHRALEMGKITVRSVSDLGEVAKLRQELDRGEAEAVVLMQEVNGDLLLLDDRRARFNAEQRGLPISGTLGILAMARDRGLVTGVAPLVDDLRRAGFRVSAALVDVIRQEDERASGG